MACSAKRVDKGGHDYSQLKNEFTFSQDVLILFRKKAGYLSTKAYIIISYLQVNRSVRNELLSEDAEMFRTQAKWYVEEG